MPMDIRQIFLEHACDSDLSLLIYHNHHFQLALYFDVLPM
jgi:hypothetical protein